jgi:hypothetical protein
MAPGMAEDQILEELPATFDTAHRVEHRMEMGNNGRLAVIGKMIHVRRRLGDVDMRVDAGPTCLGVYDIDVPLCECISTACYVL